jgi:hypothetical protein
MTLFDDAPDDADEWMPVAEAALRMGIKERQARRYAGRLDGLDRREAGREAGRVVTLVKLSAMRAARAKAVHQGDAMSQAAVVPVVETVASEGEDRRLDRRETVVETAIPSAFNDLIDQLRSENAFLRNSVEQHQRDAAEMRAALRKALDAMPKQITGDDVELRNATPPAPVVETSSGSKATEHQPTRREPRSLLRLILGLR